MFSWVRAFLVSKHLVLACFPPSDLASYNLILSELFCGLRRDPLWSSSGLLPACEVLLGNQRDLLSRNTNMGPFFDNTVQDCTYPMTHAFPRQTDL